MCRSIHTLYNFEPSATREEVHAAALQYVRKISGFTKPSQANAVAFDRAVEAVTAASERLLGELVTTAPPRNREVEAAKKRARWLERAAHGLTEELLRPHVLVQAEDVLRSQARLSETSRSYFSAP